MKRETKINIDKQKGIIIFDISGDITAFSEPILDDAYKKANELDTKKILLKFNENDYINSSGIGALLKIMQEAKRNNQEIFITGISPHFQNIFSLVGITRFAKIYNSFETAMADISE